MKKALYDKIGTEYDITRKADPEITRRVINLLQVVNKRKVIDLACGSGNYTIALSKLGLSMSGVDISEEMINKAKQKNDTINWFHADIENLPFDNNNFSGAICTLAIHHFRDLLRIFKEVNRVLQSGSRFVIFTSSPEQMKNYWLNEYFPEMMEKSIAQMPSINLVSKALKENGFNMLGYESYMIQPNLQDFFLYSGKYRPELYLKPEVRAGISSFASLARKEEVDSGIRKLEAEISNGSFRSTALKYVSESGDYLFVVAEKS